MVVGVLHHVLKGDIYIPAEEGLLLVRFSLMTFANPMSTGCGLFGDDSFRGRNNVATKKGWLSSAMVRAVFAQATDTDTGGGQKRLRARLHAGPGPRLADETVEDSPPTARCPLKPLTALREPWHVWALLLTATEARD